MLKKIVAALVLVLIFVCLLVVVWYHVLQPAIKPTSKISFAQYIDNISKLALKRGVTQQTIATYLTPLRDQQPIKHSIQTRKKMKVHKQTFAHYKKTDLTSFPLEVMQKHFDENKDLLLRVAKHYRVQPQYILVLWGLESSFGKDPGSVPMVHTLASLGYYRGGVHNYYSSELINALKVLQITKPIPQRLLSTFDGGMGQPQFQPSSYLSYAQDFDGDGFKNIWTSKADVFASIAYYLHSYHWDDQQPWGYAVRSKWTLRLLAIFKVKFSVNTWRKLGLVQWDGSPLPDSTQKATLYTPDGFTHQESYLLLPNFAILMHWNHSHYEALMTGYYADRIKVNP